MHHWTLSRRSNKKNSQHNVKWWTACCTSKRDNTNALPACFVQNGILQLAKSSKSKDPTMCRSRSSWTLIGRMPANFHMDLRGWPPISRETPTKSNSLFYICWSIHHHPPRHRHLPPHRRLPLLHHHLHHYLGLLTCHRHPANTSENKNKQDFSKF